MVALCCWLVTLKALSPCVRLTTELTQFATGDEENRKPWLDLNALKSPLFSGNGAFSSDANERENCLLGLYFYFYFIFSAEFDSS